MNKWSLLAQEKSTCTRESFSRNDTFCPHTEPVQANLDNGKIVPGSSTNCHLVPLCHVDAVLAMARNERNENERHFCSKICPQSCKEARKKEQISFGQVCSIKKIFQKMQNFGYYSNTLEE